MNTMKCAYFILRINILINIYVGSGIEAEKSDHINKEMYIVVRCFAFVFRFLTCHIFRIMTYNRLLGPVQSAVLLDKS